MYTSFFIEELLSLVPKEIQTRRKSCVMQENPPFEQAAPYVLGGDAVEREVPAEQLFDELKSLKDLVAEDIRGPDARVSAETSSPRHEKIVPVGIRVTLLP
jgi:hypothetical protein